MRLSWTGLDYRTRGELYSLSLSPSLSSRPWKQESSAGGYIIIYAYSVYKDLLIWHSSCHITFSVWLSRKKRGREGERWMSCKCRRLDKTGSRFFTLSLPPPAVVKRSSSLSSLAIYNISEIKLSTRISLVGMPSPKTAETAGTAAKRPEICASLTRPTAPPKTTATTTKPVFRKRGAKRNSENFPTLLEEEEAAEEAKTEEGSRLHRLLRLLLIFVYGQFVCSPALALFSSRSLCPTEAHVAFAFVCSWWAALYGCYDCSIDMHTLTHTSRELERERESEAVTNVEANAKWASTCCCYLPFGSACCLASSCPSSVYLLGVTIADSYLLLLFFAHWHQFYFACIRDALSSTSEIPMRTSRLHFLACIPLKRQL